jgi:glycosyltransferase involved in cell wall biosynthesis
MQSPAGAKFLQCQRASLPPTGNEPLVALVPAGGEVWEDFLDTIGLPLDQFCAEGPGGWMIGYVNALASVNVRTIIIFFSGRVDSPRRFVDPLIGTIISVLPVSASYMRLRRRFPTYRETLSRPAQAGVVRTLATGMGAALSHLSTPLRSFVRELRVHGCRAILCQEYEYFRFDACMVAGRRLGLPVFATFQGGSMDPNVLSRVWKRPLIARTAGLIIPSDAESARVRERYGAVRVARIFNPVDTAEWHNAERDEERRKHGFGQGTRVVVWHGRVDIYVKGLDLLLEAWRRIVEERPGQDVKLMLLGTGQDAPALAELIAGVPESTVRWQNGYATERGSIRRFLAAGDVYAFPSRLEGFPVAPIEAMACGLPIVAADASGIREILEGRDCGGIVVRRGDAAGLAQELGRLIDDPALAGRMGRAARRRVESALSLQAVGTKLSEFLFPNGVSS